MFWQPALLIIVGLWLTGLTIVFLWIFRQLRALLKEAGEDNLVKSLSTIAKRQQENRKRLVLLDQSLEGVKTDGLGHVQKIGVIRFNPFKEIGGDHSFSLAVLNGQDTGFILTGLHTRERTRLYLKSVSRGKAEHEISREEKEALVKAQKHQ